jgi:hypothetical protein
MDNMKMDISVILRDYEREALETLQKPTATLRATLFARVLGLQKVELEGCVFLIVQALRKKEKKKTCLDMAN